MSEPTSDLEARLRDTLGERAGAAPDATGLAAGARRRLRRRRTTLAVATAAVVAAAVPLGLTALGAGSGTTTGLADRSAVEGGLPPGVMEWGYRAESWHGVTLEVPVDWGYGGTTAWCLDGVTRPVDARPVVTRPDTAVERIGCEPAHGYGVVVGSLDGEEPPYASGDVWQAWFEGESADYPDGAWMGYWYYGQDTVTVATPDQALTRRIVDSVRLIDGVDDNECPVTLGEAEALTGSTSDSFSLCRYDADDLLTASRRFIGVDSGNVQDAIFSAPARRTDHDCPDPGPLPRTAMLAGGGFVGTVVTDATCEGLNGVFVGDGVSEVTGAVRRRVDLLRLP